MSYVKVLENLKKKRIAPIYFIYGSENYFIEKVRTEIIRQVADEHRENLTMYNLEEIPIQEVIQDAETYPFFGERNLIIATNPVFLKSKPDKLTFEHDVETLANYIENPVDYSVVVIIAAYEKIDERKKISKTLKKYAEVANCDPIKEKDIQQWIHNMVEQHDITLDQSVYSIIENELSTNLQILEVELEKLALYAGQGGHITKEIAETLISPTPNSSALRLVDAVIEKNLHRAISIFKELEVMKEDPIALIGLLAFQFRTILSVKLLKQKGYTQFQIQKQLGLHPYVVKIAMNRERRFQVNKLEKILDEITNTDAIIKQGKVEKDLAFELLLHKIIEVA